MHTSISNPYHPSEPPHSVNALSVIKQACTDAMAEAEDEEPSWRAAYVSVVDPLSVLEMAGIIETLLENAEQTAPDLAARIRAEIGTP